MSSAIPCSMQIQERVHVAPIGFEIDRVVLPFLAMKGERLHLLLRNGRNARGDRCVSEIRKDLEANKKAYAIHQVDLDLFQIIYTCRKIIDEELKNGNTVFVNMSSGGSIQAVACHFATITFRSGVSAFYAYPETYIEKVNPSRPQASAGLSRIEMVPHYSIELPDEREMRFLRIVADARIPSKRGLLDECERAGLIATTGKSKPYGHVVLENRFVKPLTDKGLIYVEDRGRRSRVRLTENGKNTLHITGWVPPANGR
jgi:hypothetical protein